MFARGLKEKETAFTFWDIIQGNVKSKLKTRGVVQDIQRYTERVI